MPRGKVHQKMVSGPKKKFWNTVTPAKIDRSKCEVGIDVIGNSGFSISGTVPFGQLSDDARARLLAHKSRLEAMLRGEDLKAYDAEVARNAVALDATRTIKASSEAKDEKKKVTEAKQFDKRMLDWLKKIGEENG